MVRQGEAAKSVKNSSKSNRKRVKLCEKLSLEEKPKMASGCTAI
jgi:hypothetical protein